MQAPESKRVIWLDCLKGFSILLVILGHVLSGYLDAGAYPDALAGFTEVREFIYSFHMPLFFLISGYTCTMAYTRAGRLDKWRYLAQMFNLLWIYVVFALIQWLVKTAFPDAVNEAYTLEDLRRMFLVPLGNFWYIYVLFLLYGIAALIQLPRLHPLYLTFFGAVSLCVADAYLNWTNLTLYRILYHFFFFAVGSVLFTHPHAVESKKLIGIAAMFLSATAMFYFWGVRSWYSNWKVMIALTISYLLFCLFAHVRLLSRPQLFRICGAYCLEIYLLHTFFTAGLRSMPFMEHISIPWLAAAVNFLLSTGLCLLLTFLLRKLWISDVLFRPSRFLRRFRWRKEASS